MREGVSVSSYLVMMYERERALLDIYVHVVSQYPRAETTVSIFPLVATNLR